MPLLTLAAGGRLFSAGRLASVQACRLSHSARLLSAAETIWELPQYTQIDCKSRRPATQAGLWSKWGVTEVMWPSIVNPLGGKSTRLFWKLTAIGASWRLSDSSYEPAPVVLGQDLSRNR